jgi:GntR family negative regulator for fad regulon and positive regulator of fabA
VRYSERIPPDFVANLLEVRLALAPAYARSAVERAASTVADLLEDSVNLDDTPEAYAAFDWTLHKTMTVASGNPVYALILNGFAGFYEEMACQYFSGRDARAASRSFYQALLCAAREGDAVEAEHITRATMQASIRVWLDAGT